MSENDNLIRQVFAGDSRAIVVGCDFSRTDDPAGLRLINSCECLIHILPAAREGREIGRQANDPERGALMSCLVTVCRTTEKINEFL